jgi:hypothetical protein
MVPNLMIGQRRTEGREALKQTRLMKRLSLSPRDLDRGSTHLRHPRHPTSEGSHAPSIKKNCVSSLNIQRSFVHDLSVLTCILWPTTRPVLLSISLMSSRHDPSTTNDSLVVSRIYPLFICTAKSGFVCFHLFFSPRIFSSIHLHSYRPH